MANVARVEATITAQNRLRPGLASAARDLQNFRQTQTRATNTIAAGVRQLALVAGASIAGVAGYGALKQATKRFAEVDRAMTRTGITGDALAEETRKGTQALRDMAQQTAQKFDPMQKGLDAITASGRDFSDAMAMMPSVSKTAQASGADIKDIADASTALIDHMKISIEGLAEAQDTLAMGGKLGKFELKDMARYLPSMLPAFKALGQTGQEGLRNLVSMLQVIRSGTGTAEEAAASAQNIFSKMESDETVKNFKEMGVDLPASLKKARKEGKNLLDVFVELSRKALKGDMSKLPQLFSDMEVQRGMRPLVDGLEKAIEMRAKLKNAKGTIDTDFVRISKDTQATLDRFGEAADRAKTALGSLVAQAAQPLVKEAADRLNELGQAFERASEAARNEGFSGALKQLRDDAVKSGQDFIPPVQDDIEEVRKARDATDIALVQSRSRNRDPRENANLDDEIKRGERAVATARTPDARAKAQKRLDALRSARNQDTAYTAPSEGELKAVARDQVRRAGLDDIPPLDLSDFDAAREAWREANRGRGWKGTAGAPDFPASAVKSKPGSLMPPVRPGSLKGAIDLPVQPLDDVKSKADEVKGSFDLLGPAAKGAGSQIASGFGTALTEIQTLDAAVSRLQQNLNGLRMPNLGGGGAGGLPTGRSMQELSR